MKIYGDVDIYGKFWPQIVIKISETDFTEDTDSGRIAFDANDENVYYGAQNDWMKINDITDLLNIGQRIIFCKSLPTGFTLVSLDDETILVTNSLSEIGTESGSWTLSGVDTSSTHNHFSTLGMGYPSVVGMRGTSEIYTYAGDRYHRHTMSSEGAHTHTFDSNWRPAWMKYILGEYTG